MTKEELKQNIYRQVHAIISGCIYNNGKLLGKFNTPGGDPINNYASMFTEEIFHICKAYADGNDYKGGRIIKQEEF